MLSLAPVSVLGAPPRAPALQATAWWDNDWAFRKQITIDHTKVDADLTNFPALIRFDSDADLAAAVQSDGDDIVFTSASGSKLDHEIEHFDGATGELVAWVNVPSLSSTTDTILYMYYGNAAAINQENVEGVWDANYMMVQHLQETTGTHKDSTSNGNDGTPQGGVTQDAIGKIEGADDFDGSDDRVDCGTGEGEEGWRNQDQGQQRAVIKDGKIYVVGGGDHSVSTFDAYIYVFDLETGAILQQSPSLGQFDFTASETAPVVDGDMVYACPTKANMSAWNTSSNTIEWTTSDFSIWSDRIEYDGAYLYATTTDYKVVKIDASNGSVVASFDLDPDTDYENAVPPYLDEANDVIFAMGGSKLYQLSASDLSENWIEDIGTGCLDTGGGHSRMAPIVVNDSYTGNEPWVIFGCWGTDIFYAYDYDGNQEWSKAIPEGVRAVASYNPNTGFLYIPSQGDKIYVLNVTNGVEQFNITNPPGGSRFNQPCTVTDNYLIFKTGYCSTCYIYIYNATTGQYITRMNLGSDLFLTCFPIAVSEGYLVTGGSLVKYGAQDGGIFAVKAGNGQAVDYYPLYGPHKYGYIENALADLAETENSLNPADEITLEAWASLDALTTGSNDHLLCRESTYCLKFAQASAGDAPRFQVYDSTGSWNNLDLSSPLATGEWYHLAGTWDGSTMQLYVNGNSQGSQSFAGTIDSTGNHTFIGSYNGSSAIPGQAPDGRIDEVRLSDVARSAEWIRTQFNNQNDPSSFYNVGSEEGLSTFYRDADGDGYGDPSDSIQAVSAPEGYVADNTDCDDTDPTIHPDAPELCDGLDNDCDGAIPDNETDADEDGVRICAGDCDDGDASIWQLLTGYIDGDGDAYGTGTALEVCSGDSLPDGYADNADDCDDTNEAINPGAEEVGNNGVDDNCDGTLVELWAVEYRWGQPPPGYSFAWPYFTGWYDVRIENRGTEDVFNVTATITGAPINTEVLDPDVAAGDIPVGGSVWSGDTYTLRVDMANPVDPCEGVVWQVEYDDAVGAHHIIEDVPQFPPGEGPCD
jgi:hypothetical protein